jgi:DNA-binding NarL/FixJ family response regulator/signal transduction histidine kinase
MPGDEESITRTQSDPISTALPRFALPEAVGLPVGREELAAIVQQFLVEIAGALGCACMAVMGYIPREERLVGVAAIGYRDDAIRARSIQNTNFPAAQRAFADGDFVTTSDPRELPAYLAEHFTGETVIVPLILGARPLSILVCRLRPGLTSRLTVWRERAREVAARAVLVVEMQRVAAEYQEELRRRQHTREIAAAILEGHPLREIADLITEKVTERLRVERAALYLRDLNGKIVPISLHGISREYGNRVTRLAYPNPLAARAISTGLPVIIDVQNEPQISPEQRLLYRSENITAVVMAMLQHGEQVRGALAIYPDAGRQFTPIEMSVIQGFADMATLGIAISQQLEQQRELAMLEERNRLQREIHDTVAQSLAALLLQLDTTEANLQAGDHAAAHEMLVAARVQAQRALQETRRAVQGLAPVALEMQSLAAAIAHELDALEEQLGTQTQFLPNGDEQPLTPDQSSALLRIAQEAINNARKHAGAGRVRVGLQYGPEEATLLVEDDGAGFDAQAPRVPGPEGGYGLFGMNERARLVGGTLEIDSTPGWGTRIRMTLPYHPSSPLPAPAQAVEEVAAPAPSPLVRSTLPTDPPLPYAEPVPGALRVLVVDDHQMARQGIRAMLERTGEVIVVGEAENGAQALTQVQRLAPDVVLMDLQMPEVDGLEGLRRIRAEVPNLPVVILTTFQTDETLTEALLAGARGFLLKDAEPADLLATIRAAHRGESLLPPAATARLAALFSGQAARNTDAQDLNEREMEVLEMLARGARNKEIAAALFIAPKTVEYHLSNLFTKLNVSNRTEAARVAIERGLVAPTFRK